MAELVLGPALRYVSQTEATVWVETDEPCTVEVLGHQTRTFAVERHHYALARIEGLPPGSATPYEVRLDGARAWPPADDPFPPCAIRTLPAGEPVRLAFGSCRVAAPHEPPYTLAHDADPDGFEVDALYALARRMLREPPERWPHAMLWLGDQIYVDEGAPDTRRRIAARRDTRRPPGTEVADFEEYTWLYHEAWSEPTIRWFLSTVSSSMIWDDHDVHDDWNTSLAWTRRMRRQPWWDRRLVGAIMSYWVYQHIGNLAPPELDADDCYRRVIAAEDATEALSDFALQAEREVEGTRWSYHRDLGGARLVVMDSRAGRVLKPDRRTMFDDQEWDWIRRQASGAFDHLLLGTSLPWLLLPAMHHVEAWDEAVAEGAWGRRAAGVGERLREAQDLEHWAAFGKSFAELTELVGEVATGRRGGAPASVVALSGDVHHAYLVEAAFRDDDPPRAPVWQAVCSPVRNPLTHLERRAIRLGATRPVAATARLLARAARVRRPAIRWRLAAGPWFDNEIATLTIDGRHLEVAFERALEGDDPTEPVLETVYERRLA
jgi:hypothetical protein